MVVFSGQKLIFFIGALLDFDWKKIYRYPMAKTSSGTKLVPPPKDFVPQGDYLLGHRVKTNASESSLMGNSSVEEESHFLGEGDVAGVQEGNGQHSSQNPLYKVCLVSLF